jgi:sugar phosphate permease
MSKMAKNSRFFYGWVIVGISLIGTTLIYGIRHSFSVFFPYILDEFSWTRGSTAIMLSLNILIYGFLAPIAGSLGDRWKPRRVMPFGIFILGLATASCAFAHRLWHFYLLFGILMPIGTAFSGWPVLAPALANWFVKKRGLAVGLGQVGGGLSFSYSIFAEFAISQLGWRYAYFVLAGTLVAVLLPLYVLFYYRPEEKGLQAYGIGELSADKYSTPNVRFMENHGSREWTLTQAIGTYQLWLMVMSNFLFWGIGNYLVLAHQVKFTEDIGYSSMVSASILGLFGIFMVAGQASAGISDLVGREKTITLAAILSVSAIIALLSVKDTSQTLLLFVYATCFGYGAGLYVTTIFAGTADIFHGRNLGAIAGLVLTGTGLGGAVGPWLGGYLYDISGSYRTAFSLCIACYSLGCIMVWIAAPRNAAKLRSID